MSATAKWIMCGASLGFALSASWVNAGTHPLATGLAVSLAAQGAGADVEAAKLAAAREAMKAGRLDDAEKLIDEATRLGVKHDDLMARFKDSPDKARVELQKLHAKQGAGAAPSSRFSAWPPATNKPAPSNMGAPAADPFAARASDATIDRMTNDSKSKAARYLENGRNCLKQGDVAGAIAWHTKAREEKATFAANEYSPDMLAADLRQAGVDPSRLPASTAGAPRFNTQAMPEGDRDLAAQVPGYGQRTDMKSAFPGATVMTPDDVPQDRNPLTRSQTETAQYGPAATPRRLPTTGNEPGPSVQKQQAMQLMARARLALDQGDVQAAHHLAQQAQNMRVAESEFSQDETRPWQLVLETERAVSRRGGNFPVTQAGAAVQNATYNDRGGYAVQRGVYNPQNDGTRNMAVQATEVAPEPAQLPTVAQGGPEGRAPQVSEGQQYYEAGMQAFAAGDRATALQHFKQAWKLQSQLPPQVVSQLKDKLIALETPRPDRLPNDVGSSPLEQVDQKTELHRQKLLKEIQTEEAAVQGMRTVDPEGGLDRLKQLRERVNGSGLDPASTKSLLRIVDSRIIELEQYIEVNRADIDLANANRKVRIEIEREQLQTIEGQTKLAELVEQFNRLIDEQRYAEAEVVAKQAYEIAPNEPVVQALTWKAKFVKRTAEQMALQGAKEGAFVDTLLSVEQSSVPFDDREPYTLGDPKNWNDLTKRRRQLLNDMAKKMSPAEMEIRAALEKPVEVSFLNRPLAEVVDTLGKMANVNIYLDPQGLHAEGVESNTPVSLNLSKPVALRSALTLILEQLRLSYIIQNEVLRITSQQTRDANLQNKVYNVADLVIPIPNFTPSYSMGLPGAIREAHNTLGYGGAFSSAGVMPMTFAQNNSNPSTMAGALAQSGMSGSMGGRPSQLMSGPGSLGGGVQADFDSLIELITTTVQPNTWKEGGTGEGTIAPFETNLSVVVSQTEEVHKEIADLLEQLRRLQDLQVTIEVRFITLNDNFFERIGVDFDFNIDDNTAGVPILPDDTGPSMVIGLGPDGQPTANRDVMFTQNSFATAIPQFGGFDPATAANFGFAILSDIEVYFLLVAASGDTRTNVLQAPKVTLFNGQQAVVSDTSQRPFVTSVIPVVGDFAAAQQPVIVVLSEGTSLSVQAVVSADRRFVRLTLVPFFSQIGDVEEFTFTGSSTTNTGTAVIDPTDPDRTVNDGATTTTTGTTVQLPTFSFTTVTTTVSVPDGGTVLLGGIKRLNEGRTERGVPLLSKIPYASRLFKNVGIGRTTQSLMMMVTPRIIIQEEEEAKIVGGDAVGGP